MAIKTPKIYTKAQWNRLSKARKAVIVAADTIQWIKLGKFTPKSGVYCQLSDKIVEKPHDIRHVKNNCIGCAKGGLFYSKCMAHNELDRSNLEVDNYFEIKDFTTYHDPSDSLTDCFTKDELEQIEECFEGWAETLDFYYDDNWVLLFICLHIIKNRGQVKLAELNEQKAIKFHNEVVLPYVRRNRSLWRVLSNLSIVEFME
jgi:hypothetical protein